MTVLKSDEASQASFKIKTHRWRVESQLTEIVHVQVIHFPCLSKVQNAYAQPSHKIRLLAHVGDDGLPLEFAVREYFGVRFESDDGAVHIRISCFFHLRNRFTSVFIFLKILSAIAVHFGAHRIRKSVYDGNADAVKAA